MRGVHLRAWPCRTAPFAIAHISDLHCGGPYFEPNLLERAISEVNDLEPDIVVCSGDLTTFGFKHEYQVARAVPRQAATASRSSSIPGNHDSRNVGYVHFEELFGERNSVLRKGGVAVVAVDSTEPDLDHGQIGRGRYRWIEEEFAAEPAELRIFVLHHHLLPVPGTGRERNVVYDAGDAIECLQRAGVHLVLSGHKHVPYAWRLENLFVVNTGTVSSLRLRGNTRPCYNVIEISGQHVDIWRRHPFHGQERIIQFSTGTFEYEKYTGRIEQRGDLAADETSRSPLIDGEHYAAGGARCARRPAARGRRGRARRRDARSSAAARTTACRSRPALEEAIDELRRRSVVLDLSDEPVLGPVERLRARRPRARARRCRTRAPTSGFEPPVFAPVDMPSLAIVGTGKRVGKTAITGHVARLLARDRRVVVVAMGRGGPPEPEVVARARRRSTTLLELSRAGRHAASDHLETAALAGVDTVGCRRCGGGLAGAVVVSNVAGGRAGRRRRWIRSSSSSTAAARRSHRSPPRGACSSSARTRTRRRDRVPERATALLLADLVVVAMAEDATATRALRSACARSSGPASPVDRARCCARDRCEPVAGAASRSSARAARGARRARSAPRARCTARTSCTSPETSPTGPRCARSSRASTPSRSWSS